MPGKDGRPVVLLGLSEANLSKLVEGKPILVDSKDLGVDNGPMIAIIAGPTEQDIEQEMKKFFTLPIKA